ncbi:MAG: hypothetical protein D6712_16230 [Chloroflexi bacterium]|nr:MAG: hypothetical protein D6712_16230 [Chloroflexota bacterium]
MKMIDIEHLRPEVYNAIEREWLSRTEFCEWCFCEHCNTNRAGPMIEYEGITVSLLEINRYSLFHSKEYLLIHDGEPPSGWFRDDPVVIEVD